MAKAPKKLHARMQYGPPLPGMTKDVSDALLLEAFTTEQLLHYFPTAVTAPVRLRAAVAAAPHTSLHH